MRIGPKRIPDKLYKEIVASMPIACVDIVVRAGKEFILVKRKDEPAKGTWWHIGGRVLKGESLERAVVRKIKEELGVRSVRINKFLASKETMFQKSFWGVSTHTINSVFLVDVNRNLVLRKDRTIEDIQWFSKIQSAWPLYVKETLRLAGFK